MFTLKNASERTDVLIIPVRGFLSSPAKVKIETRSLFSNQLIEIDRDKIDEFINLLNKAKNEF